jgi:inner membrane protein
MLTTWVIAGGVLVLLELFLPGMVLGFLGASALLVAAFTWLGWLDTWVASLTTWFVVSLILLISLRGFFQRLIGGDVEQHSTDEELDAFGVVVDVVETITPEQQGRIHYRGATWQASCLDQTIEAGGKATLVCRDNLVWVVEPARPSADDPAQRS